MAASSGMFTISLFCRLVCDRFTSTPVRSMLTCLEITAMISSLIWSMTAWEMSVRSWISTSCSRSLAALALLAVSRRKSRSKKLAIPASRAGNARGQLLEEAAIVFHG
jgi:hypothetical protein